MQSLIIGFIVLVAITISSLQQGSLFSFFTWHSVALVMGGTLGILFLATPWRVLKVLARALMNLFTPDEMLAQETKNLKALSQNRINKIETQNLLILYAHDLWAQGVEQVLFTGLLIEKKRELDLRQLDTVQALKNLSKYPPALGMLGTVMGMIGLFADLDHNQSMIGQNLSMALTATFLGLVTANLIVSPLADRLQIQQAKIQQLNANLLEILLLINQNEAKSLIEEELHARAS